MIVGRIARHVRGSGWKWLLPAAAAVCAAVLGFGGPPGPDDRVLIAAADLRPALLALAGAADAARDSGEPELLDRAAAAVRSRSALVRDALGGEHPAIASDAQELGVALDALMQDAYVYASGADPAGAGSASFVDASQRLEGLTQQLLEARRAAGMRTALSSLLAALSAGGALAFGIVEGVALRRRAAWVARVDPVTGLLRQSVLVRDLDTTLDQRQGRGAFALIIDVTTLSDVAQTAGRAEADAYFREFADRIVAAFGDAGRVGRGDGYSLVVCGHLFAGDGPAHLASTALVLARDPLTHDGRRLDVSVCIGYTASLGHESPADELVQNASLALSQAQRSGQNVVRSFVPASDTELRDRIAMGTALARALEQDEFTLLYQPIVEAATWRIVGAEALVRWSDPARGDVSPDEFIPLLEASGRIEEVGAWVLQSACEQLAVWRGAGHRDFRIAVNVSVRQFADGQLGRRIRELLEATGLDPRALEIEVTESLAADGSSYVVETLRELGALGVTASLDDFGTGQSSLSRLREFPLQTLKLDQSFAAQLGVVSEAPAVIHGMVQMAHAMGLLVVVEGVETVAQRDVLNAAGCDLMQGYLFSRPVSAAELSRLLVDQDAAAA